MLKNISCILMYAIASVIYVNNTSLIQKTIEPHSLLLNSNIYVILKVCEHVKIILKYLRQWSIVRNNRTKPNIFLFVWLLKTSRWKMKKKLHSLCVEEISGKIKYLCRVTVSINFTKCVKSNEKAIT